MNLSWRQTSRLRIFNSPLRRSLSSLSTNQSDTVGGTHIGLHSLFNLCCALTIFRASNRCLSRSLWHRLLNNVYVSCKQSCCKHWCFRLNRKKKIGDLYVQKLSQGNLINQENSNVFCFENSTSNPSPSIERPQCYRVFD